MFGKLFFADQQMPVIIMMPNNVLLESSKPICRKYVFMMVSYHTVALKGTDVDQPRNLAKSVTVE